MHGLQLAALLLLIDDAAYLVYTTIKKAIFFLTIFFLVKLVCHGSFWGSFFTTFLCLFLCFLFRFCCCCCCCCLFVFLLFLLFLFVCVCFHNPSTTGATDTCCFSYRQLQNERHYSKLKKDPTVQIAKTSNELVNRLHIDGHIDDITCRWALVEPNSVRCHQFHLLPQDPQDVDEHARATHRVMCERTHRQSVQTRGPLAAGPRRQPVQLHQGHHPHATYAPAVEPRLRTIQGRGEACPP